MVRRSLILKIYLYAVGALLATFVLAFGASRLLLTHGMGDAFRQMGQDYAQFIGREIEASFEGGRPSPARLDELARSLHLQLDYVPVGSDREVPAELAGRDWVDQRVRFFGPHVYWVRMDPGGEVMGALRIEFRPPRPAGGLSGWIFAGVLMGALGLMIVPPLYLWVIRPLRHMVDTAHRLGSDLSTPVGVDRKDEFGDLEEAFESLRRRIQRMLTQKERLLTDISHELRGPLSRMAVALPLARAEGQDNPYLGHLERNMAAMDRLIGELLTLSRGQTPPERDQEALDLAAIARDLLAERSVVTRSQGVELESQLMEAPVRGDRRLLERAMGNLIDNALRHGASPIRVETGQEGGQALFEVTDHGPGIPEADLPHLFEPFYRPDASRSRQTGGTGLGLAIVKAVAESHGGEAALSSRPGEGTVARMRFPLRPDSPEAPQRRG